MYHYIRYILCFALGAILALSVSLSSSENTESPYQQSNEYDYSVLIDVIDTVETYYVDKVDRSELVQAAIKGIFTHLDPYSSYLSQADYQAVKEANKGQYFGYGFEVATDNEQITIVAPFARSPAAKAGILAGDIILRLNDAEVLPDNLQAILAEIKQNSNNGLPITLDIQHRNEVSIHHIVLKPEVINIDSINARILNGNIGYIHIASFQNDATENIQHLANQWALLSLKGIVIDVRNNPGGLLDQAISIADLFLNEGLIVSTEGRFTESNERYYASTTNLFNTLPIAVLINKGSASASEVLAAALQENNRATLIGETSFGKGTVQSLLPMTEQGNAVKLTIAKYITPNGHDIHKQGIEPDIKIVNPTVSQSLNVPIIGNATETELLSDININSAIGWINSN